MDKTTMRVSRARPLSILRPLRLYLPAFCAPRITAPRQVWYYAVAVLILMRAGTKRGQPYQALSATLRDIARL